MERYSKNVPNSKPVENSLAENGSTIFNQNSGRHPKVFVKTFGCQMNVRDSEHVAGLLADNGFRLSGSIDRADVILFNSCSVRKHAEDRLFANIADLRKLKMSRPGLVIALMGCTAQAYGARAMNKSPLVDIICGTGNESDLPRLIRDALDSGRRIIAVDKVDRLAPEAFPRYREHKFKALVSISQGCDNMCSYCVVPHVRGKERSRKMKDIIKEVRGLADRGFKEITLLGQNVNSYNSSPTGLAFSVERIAYKKKLADKNSGFVRLLEELNKIDGIERIRFMTSHPKDAHAELFKAMRDLEKVCEHLHLPLQSGSDRILKLMNRKYGAEKFLKLTEAYRKILPDGSITTDIIVGFPSETTEDFGKTIGIMKTVGFDSAYMFKYSPRPDTRAARLIDDVPDAVKASRLERIMNLQCGISEKINASLVGRRFDVLLEALSDDGKDIASGRTGTNKPVFVKGGKPLPGKLVKVEVESATPYTLKGRII